MEAAGSVGASSAADRTAVVPTVEISEGPNQADTPADGVADIAAAWAILSRAEATLLPPIPHRHRPDGAAVAVKVAADLDAADAADTADGAGGWETAIGGSTTPGGTAVSRSGTTVWRTAITGIRTTIPIRMITATTTTASPSNK